MAYIHNNAITFLNRLLFCIGILQLPTTEFDHIYLRNPIYSVIHKLFAPCDVMTKRNDATETFNEAVFFSFLFTLFIFYTYIRYLFSTTLPISAMLSESIADELKFAYNSDADIQRNILSKTGQHVIFQLSIFALHISAYSGTQCCCCCFCELLSNLCLIVAH